MPNLLVYHPTFLSVFVTWVLVQSSLEISSSSHCFLTCCTGGGGAARCTILAPQAPAGSVEVGAGDVVSAPLDVALDCSVASRCVLVGGGSLVCVGGSLVRVAVRLDFVLVGSSLKATPLAAGHASTE